MMTIRYLLYTGPSREFTIQIGPDVESNDHPRNKYGSEIMVEGEPYIIANMCIAKLVPKPGEERTDIFDAIFQVFLARPEEWPEFGEPELFRLIRQQQMKDELDERQN